MKASATVVLHRWSLLVQGFVCVCSCGSHGIAIRPKLSRRTCYRKQANGGVTVGAMCSVRSCASSYRLPGTWPGTTEYCDQHCRRMPGSRNFRRRLCTERQAEEVGLPPLSASADTFHSATTVPRSE